MLELAQKETPPHEVGQFRKTDLVDLETIDARFQFDIRYATSNNFVGIPLYSHPKAYLQRPAAAALQRAAKSLEKEGYGLIIYDGYRPWHVTWMFWQVTPDDKKIFLADPNEGSKHNRGCAVDLGMYLIETRESVEFPSDFDEMTERSFSDYAGATKQQALHRKILRDALEAQGFTVHPKEWWHFDYKDWPHYSIQNFSFEDLLISNHQGPKGL